MKRNVKIMNMTANDENLKIPKIETQTSAIQQWTSGIKFNKSNKSKVKSPGN